MKASKPREFVAPRAIINVTKEHMTSAKAMKKRSDHCAIVLAIQDAVPKATHITVDLQTIRWSDKNKGLRYSFFTPKKAFIFLVRWDYAIDSEPFSFPLRGAHITSMQKSTPKGKPKRSHKLGKRRISMAPNQEKKIRVRPDIIGGRPPPLTHVSSGIFAHHREFGRRGMSLPDIFGDRDPREVLGWIASDKAMSEA